MRNKDKIIKLFFLLYPIIASVLCLLLEVDYLFSSIIFFGIPALIISFLDGKIIGKVALFAIILSVPLAAVLDYIAHLTGTWFVASSNFPRLLGYIIVEDFIWGFLYAYFVVLFYEYFIDHKVKDKLYYPNIKYLIILLFFVLCVFFLTLTFNPSVLNIKYFYLKFGIVLGILPISYLIFKFPSLYAKLLKAGAYFFYLTFIYEITGLTLGLWSFPGEYFIGWIRIFGVAFPIEELVFWMILGTISVLSYYELFDDRPKTQKLY